MLFVFYSYVKKKPQTYKEDIIHLFSWISKDLYLPFFQYDFKTEVLILQQQSLQETG